MLCYHIYDGKIKLYIIAERFWGKKCRNMQKHAALYSDAYLPV